MGLFDGPRDEADAQITNTCLFHYTYMADMIVQLASEIDRETT